MPAPFETIDLGRLSYAAAYEHQQRTVDKVLAARDNPESTSAGIVLTVEHDPVITVSRRANAPSNILADPGRLAREGVEVAQTDRGGDVTYHGPGQLVVYPILDLNRLNLGIHDYMRLLEQAVMDTAAAYGITAERDPTATGVWVRPAPDAPAAKLCAFGVRVRRWVSMHGLAINITTNLAHFDLIVPCGLAGRGVTTLHSLLGDKCPSWSHVRSTLLENLARLVNQRQVATTAMRASRA